jgi:hypothetical protein
VQQPDVQVQDLLRLDFSGFTGFEGDDFMGGDGFWFGSEVDI